MDMDVFYAQVERNIAECFCHLTGVGTDPPFTYTTGLTNEGLPELILTGMGGEQSTYVLNYLVKYAIDNDMKFKHGTVFAMEPFNDMPVTFIKVKDSVKTDMMCITRIWHNGEPFDALQVVWCDPNKKFHWDDGFEEKFRYLQELLGDY